MKEQTETRDTETSQSLGEELSLIKDRSTDGWIEGKIVSVRSPDSDIVSLTVQHPNKKEFVWNLEKPSVWSDEFKLVRLVEHSGYSAETVHYLEDEHINIRPNKPSRYPSDTSSTWELEIPTSTLRSRIASSLPMETLVVGGMKLLGSLVIAAIPTGAIAVLGRFTPFPSLIFILSVIMWITLSCTIFIRLAVVPHLHRHHSQLVTSDQSDRR